MNLDPAELPAPVRNIVLQRIRQNTGNNAFQQAVVIDGEDALIKTYFQNSHSQNIDDFSTDDSNEDKSLESGTKATNGVIAFFVYLLCCGIKFFPYAFLFLIAMTMGVWGIALLIGVYVVTFTIWVYNYYTFKESLELIMRIVSCFGIIYVFIMMGRYGAAWLFQGISDWWQWLSNHFV